MKMPFANISRLDQRPYHLPVDNAPVSQFERDRAVKTVEFVRKNPDLIEYCQRVQNSFTANCLRKMAETGEMTGPQIAAIRRSLGGAVQPRMAAARPIATDVQGNGFTKLLDGFKHARATGLKNPRLVSGNFVFTYAKEGSNNPGFVYVKLDGEYKGKVSPEGRFFAARDVTIEETAQVVKVGRDPFSAAVEHGKLTGRCAVCSRLLTDTNSVTIGIGPICAKKFGW
jgi:hypothetical protein